jgi:DNA-directed RNA polymerase subunit RPC12/RpoP
MPKVHWMIPCPICGKRLRVLDQSLLGRRGQCPSCRHKFTLEVPKSSDFIAKHPDSKFDIEMAPPEDTLKFDGDFEFPTTDDGDTHSA